MTCAVNLGVVHVKTLGGKDANRIRIRLDTIVLVLVVHGDGLMTECHGRS